MHRGEGKYRELFGIGDGTRFLVEDETTGKKYVRKDEQNVYAKMYEYLKNNRNVHLCGIQDYYDKKTHITVYEEYIRGVTLEELLAQGELRFDETVNIIFQICDGLEFLHKAVPPIVHRDLKLSNIMITDEGVVKIIDFGAAKNIERGKDRDTVLLGTPEYAAPEQYGFAASDERTDIYALGAILEKLSVQGRFTDIIKKAKAMDPENRYRSVAEFREAFMAECCRFEGKGNAAAAEYEEQNRTRVRHIKKHPGIPGFRSGNPVKRVIAICGYIMIIFACICELIKAKGIVEKIENTALGLFFYLSFIDAMFDWTGIFSVFPGYHSEIKWLKITMRTMAWFCGIMIVSVFVYLFSLFN